MRVYIKNKYTHLDMYLKKIVRKISYFFTFFFSPRKSLFFTFFYRYPNIISNTIRASQDKRSQDKQFT